MLKTGLFEWAQLDSNQRPMDYESTALTAELRAREISKFFNTNTFAFMLSIF